MSNGARGAGSGGTSASREILNACSCSVLVLTRIRQPSTCTEYIPYSTCLSRVITYIRQYDAGKKQIGGMVAWYNSI